MTLLILNLELSLVTDRLRSYLLTLLAQHHCGRLVLDPTVLRGNAIFDALRRQRGHSDAGASGPGIPTRSVGTGETRWGGSGCGIGTVVLSEKCLFIQLGQRPIRESRPNAWLPARVLESGVQARVPWERRREVNLVGKKRRRRR